MITSIISGIVSKLSFASATPNFYEGAHDELNKAFDEENSGFVFLLRAYRWNSDIKASGQVNTTYNISLGFFKRTSYEDDNVTSADTNAVDALFTLFKNFLKEAYKQGYKIKSVSGEDVFNDKSFDNNVSGVLANIGFLIENEYVVCN